MFPGTDRDLSLQQSESQAVPVGQLHSIQNLELLPEGGVDEGGQEVGKVRVRQQTKHSLKIKISGMILTSREISKYLD